MPNTIFGPGPAQVPRNSDLGALARLDTLPFRRLIFTSGQLWSPPRPVWANIYVTGGGGSPGTNSAAHDGSTGGAGGGTAIKFGVLLLPTNVYTLIVGAGGAQAASGMEGNHGSDSSFSGPGITTLTGQGGRRGNRLLSNIATAISFVPAEGGQAVGGDINMRGGPGLASMGVHPFTVGYSPVGAASVVVLAGPGGGSYWGPGGTTTSAPSNYGEGAAGTGVNGLSQGHAGRQGVIMLEFND